MWDWRSAKIVFRPGHRVDTEAVTFSPDNRLVALGPADGTVRILEIDGGKEVRRLEAGQVATHLEFSPDGSQIAVNSQTTCTVRVYEVATGRLVATLTHADQVMGIAWHPREPMIAVANHDHRIYLWDVAGAGIRTVLARHRHIVYFLDFTPDGGLLLSQGSDGSKLTDLATSQSLTLPEPFRRFSRDGRRMAGIGADRVEIWGLDAPLEYLTVTIPRMARYPESRGQFSPDGRWLAAPIEGGVQVWDAASGRLVARVSVDGANAFRFHPGGGELFIGGQRGLERRPLVEADGTLRIGEARSMPGPIDVRTIELDRDGRTLVAAEPRGVWILDLGPSPAPPRYLEHNASFLVSVSPDGRWIASRKISAEVRFWESGSGRVVKELEHEPITGNVAFSPDGRHVVTGTKDVGGLSMREVSSWREVWRLDPPARPASAMAFSADGSLLAMTGTPEDVQLVDPITGRSFATLRAPYDDKWTWLALSPDGSRLAAGLLGQNGVGIWDLRRLRRRLAEMGLDWEGPPGPATPPADAEGSTPVKVGTVHSPPGASPTGGGL